MLYSALRFSAQRSIVVVRDGVRDDREGIAGQSVHACDDLCAFLETVGDDRDRRDAEPLGFYGVVQTARRAAPSIPDA